MSSVLDVPRTCGLLTEDELDITENYDAVTLLEKIAARELTSHSVTTAFCKRAAITQQLVSSVPFGTSKGLLTRARPVVSLRRCLKMLLRGRITATSISRKRANF